MSTEVNDLFAKVDWKAVNIEFSVSAEHADKLKTLGSMLSSDRGAFLINNFDVLPLLLRIVSSGPSHNGNCLSAAEFLAAVLVESCRVEPSLLDAVVSRMPFDSVCESLLQAMRGSVALKESSVQFLGAVVSKSSSGQSIKVKTSFLEPLFAGKLDVSQHVQLCVISSMVKNEGLRASLFEFPTVLPLIVTGLQCESDVSQTMYRALFSLWCSSFSQSIVSTKLVQFADIICARLAFIVRSVAVEKAARLALLCVQNLIPSSSTQCATFAESFVASNMLADVKSMANQKWRDPEMVTIVSSVSDSLAEYTGRLSSFERYVAELKNKKLTCAHLHTEKFLTENAKHFEENNFEAVRKLVDLLTDESVDLVSKATACHDLGEYSRLAPHGRKVLTKLNAKSAVMNLLSSEDRSVAREALLTTQKIMLSHWASSVG